MDDEQESKPQSPSERALILASIACFVSYSIAKRVVEPLEIGWAKYMVYALIPISVTFIILYRSCWHPEITGIARTYSLLLFACIILSIVLLTFEFVLCVAPIFIAVFSNGSGPG